MTTYLVDWKIDAVTRTGGDTTKVNNNMHAVRLRALLIGARIWLALMAGCQPASHYELAPDMSFRFQMLMREYVDYTFSSNPLFANVRLY